MTHLHRNCPGPGPKRAMRLQHVTWDGHAVYQCHNCETVVRLGPVSPSLGHPCPMEYNHLTGRHCAGQHP